MVPNNSRLQSLDVMRGMTIAGMILVNNPGSWAYIYAPLEHAQWNGLTPTDLVFPFFMFIMGVSTYFSLRKYDFRYSSSALVKILRRAVLLILIGWAIGWIGRFWSGMQNPDQTWVEAVNNFSNMRILGVFPRLGICYGVTALLAIFCSRRCLAWIAGVILVGYSVLLLVGDGFVFAQSNILGVVDRAVLGDAHIYHEAVDDVRLGFDPEGLLSTLPSIAHCIIGFLCGAMIVRTPGNTQRSYNLMLIGAVLTIAGLLLDYGVPINKKVWSPTFVLTTCGLACTVLGLLIYVIDIRRKDRWCTFFRVFGINPLSLYVIATLLSIALIRIKVAVHVPEDDTILLKSFIYKYNLLPLCGDDSYLASLVFALLFVLVNWCVGYILYRKKIIIKI